MDFSALSWPYPDKYPGRYPTPNRTGGSAVTRYAVIYELANDGSWHARAAEFPVFTCGDSREEAERLIREAIAFHLEEDLREGRELPPESADVGTVDVDVPSVVTP